MRAFHYAENANTAAELFLSLGGLLLGAGCDAGGNIVLTAQSGANDSYVRASNGQSDANFDSGQSIDLDTPVTVGVVSLAFRRGAAAANSSTFDSNSVSAVVAFDSNPGTGPACQASGTAIGRP